MTNFKEKVIARIKEYFPDAELKYPDLAYENSISLEMGVAHPIKEDELDIDWAHKRFIRRMNAEHKEVEFLIFSDLSELRFYRAPDIVFIRNIGYEEQHEFSSNDTFHLFDARFSLGYKI